MSDDSSQIDDLSDQEFDISSSICTWPLDANNMAGDNTTKEQNNRKCIFSFISPSTTNRISYKQQKQLLSAAMLEHPWFYEGNLLETMEKGVLFPVIHNVEVPPAKLSSTVPLLHSSVLGENFVLEQGIYTEIKEFRPDNEHLLRISLRPNENRSFIFLAFKTLDSTFSEVLEESWKDWTGVRQIYLNLPDELGLSRFAFYRRMPPSDASSFIYILTAQCECVPTSNYFLMLDFVHRFRVQKMMGYITVYRGLRTDSLNNNQRSHGYINGVLDHIDDQGTKVDI